MSASSTRITRARVTRAPHDQPLTEAAMRAGCPAIFATAPFTSVSARYEYVPTHTILEQLLAEGYTCHEVAQSKPHLHARDPFVKHMLRMRAPAVLRGDNDVIPEIIIINSHDGTGKYHIIGGLYRFICCNGLMAGETITSMVVRHSGFGTAARVIEGSFKIVKEEFPKLIQARTAMLLKDLTREEQVLFAHRALALRYPLQLPPFGAEDLLTVRRTDDEGNDVWHVLNRVQENIIDGGFKGTGNGLFRRALTVRPVERVGAVTSINRGIWDNAMALVAA